MASNYDFISNDPDLDPNHSNTEDLQDNQSTEDYPQDAYNDDEALPEEEHVAPRRRARDEEDEDDHKVKPVSVLKVILWIGAGIGVLVAALIVYALVFTDPEVPKLTMKPVEAKPIKPAAPVAPEPGGYDPTLDQALNQSMGQEAVDPNGLTSPAQVTTVDNTTHSPIDTTISPFTGQSVAPNTAANAPAAGVAQTTTNTAMPVNGANSGVMQPTPVQPAPPVSPEAKQDERIAALEAKIAELEELINKLTAPKPKRVAAIRKENTMTEVVPKKEKVVAAVKPNASKEQATATTESKPVTTESPTIASVSVAQKPAARPHLVAIVPGRAFLQNSEGIRSDVAVGDNVSGCGSVIKIDADSAEVVTDRCVIR